MAFASGTVDVGGEPVPLCAVGNAVVGNAAVRVRNHGTVIVFLGGPDVSTDGYPLEPGTSEILYGGLGKETPVVPAPAGDEADAVLYARTAGEPGRVSWIRA